MLVVPFDSTPARLLIRGREGVAVVARAARVALHGERVARWRACR